MLAAIAGASLLAAQSEAPDYRVGPKDLLEIKVFEVPELNVERRISDEGDLDLPLVGPVPVGNLTLGEVRATLQRVLEVKYVRHASVSVIIKEFRNQPISILGAVARPGPLSSAGRWSLLQGIGEAGGLTPAAGNKIYILRHAENGLSDRLEINTADLMTRSDSRWNVPIYPNDVINIPPQAVVRVFVIGQVKTPGAVEMSSDDRITLLSILAKAGGLTDRASHGEIRIKRRGSDGKDREIAVPYRRILAGKQPDPELQPGDVVIVKESFF